MESGHVLHKQGECAAPSAFQPSHGRSSPECQDDPPTCQQQQQQDPTAAGQDDEVQYLVRFRQYRMAEQHLATIAAALRSLKAANGSEDGPGYQQAWRWIERRNKAAAYPTDFGLLACKPAVVELLKVPCCSACTASFAICAGTMTVHRE
jgi:hypothetical protein